MEYRRDIDGLRAVAVLPVILFHAGLDVFQGGFLGVDVFFVISGFLITSILISELNSNTFSLINFYERRARRILPALFAVLIATSLAGLVFMPPYEFKEYSQSLVSVVSFLSNIFFYLEIDYFSLGAEEMPLLHTWSLAIEEQYYLFFPLILYVAWKISSRSVLVFLTLLTILSLFFAVYLNAIGNQSASFYWIISRAWELLAGSLCAFLINKNDYDFKFSADIGLGVLVVSILVWPGNITHPGIYTLIPVLATCLIILSLDKSSLAYRFLSSQFLVGIGLISYSLYLWHQPILAFLRIKTVGQPGQQAFFIAIAITFLLALLTYKFIETPFRNKHKYDRKFIFLFSVLFLSSFGLIGLGGHFSQGFYDRFAFIEPYNSADMHSPERKNCHSRPGQYINYDDACVYFNENATWASFGDSHTVEIAHAMAEELKVFGQGVRHLSFSGCAPALNFILEENKVCTQWIKETLEQLEKDKTVNNVLIGFRYSSDIFGDNAPDFPEVPKDVAMEIVDGDTYSDQEKKQLYWAGLEEIVVRLVKSGKHVILMDPVPELPVHISKAAAPFSVFGSDTLVDLQRSTSKSYYNERHAFILEKLSSLNLGDRLKHLRVYELLCSEEGCPAVIGDSTLYFDHHHLSVDGARILIKRFFAENPDLLERKEPSFQMSKDS